MRETTVQRSSVADKIRTCRCLLVGAGGIGCELVKNLVLSGFAEIHIIDLDTIDLSNLNRQFLFRSHHIKKSKALVAKEQVQRFNPSVHIEANHANIKDQSFDLTWFQSFDIVFNALDNVDARRYVNKMCLMADTPLIESGSTGFEGQTYPILRGQTPCYDCYPTPTPKTFAICTIRSTPSQPIHCIVWAKSYLFPQLFGIDEDESPAFDNTVTTENLDEIEHLRKEATELRDIREGLGSDEFVEKVFDKIFTRDIERLRQADVWKGRKAPRPLSYDTLYKGAAEISTWPDHRPWTLEESFAMFRDSIQRCSARLQRERAQGDPSLQAPTLMFDKDDQDTLDFVAAAASLRCEVFGIPTHSKFQIKEMAGNIIPAIATTNAIIAGVCVLQAYRMLQLDIAGARKVYLVRRPHTIRNIHQVLCPEKIAPPNPQCEVCGVAQGIFEVDVHTVTLRKLIEQLGKIGYGEEISIVSDNLLYDIDFDDNLDRTLADLGITNGKFCTIIDEDDENQTPLQNLVLGVREKAGAFSLPDVEIVRKPKPALVAPEFESVPDTEVQGTKRKADEMNGPPTKKSKADTVEIIDEGFIEID